MTLKDKIALVTGASRGIGRAISLALAAEGAFVVGTATTEEGAKQISAAFEESSFSGKGMALNVADMDAIEHCFSEINTHHGAPLILVNNAAVTRDNLMLRMKDEEWDQVINTNLTSVYRTTKQALKGMIKARWGRIINISSVVGCTGNAGQANYAAAKAGVIGFSKSLAQEIASRNITVNVIAPGFIDTDMTRALNETQRAAILNGVPMGRLGDASEIAAAVSFLASDQAAYITGQTLHVNGGLFMP